MTHTRALVPCPHVYAHTLAPTITRLLAYSSQWRPVRAHDYIILPLHTLVSPHKISWVLG